MSHTRTVLIAGVMAGLLPALVAAQDNAECLVSLSATGSSATASGGGRLVSGTPDSSGNCVFTLTACVDDTSDATCTPGPVNSFRIQSPAHDAEVAPLQDALQAHLPAPSEPASTPPSGSRCAQEPTARCAASAASGRRSPRLTDAATPTACC